MHIARWPIPRKQTARNGNHSCNHFWIFFACVAKRLFGASEDRRFWFGFQLSISSFEQQSTKQKQQSKSKAKAKAILKFDLGRQVDDNDDAEDDKSNGGTFSQ
jgi:hypothetical protein